MQSNLKQLIKIIQVQLNTNNCRSEFIARFLTSLIKSRSVNLADISSVFNITNKFESNYRRIQRFFEQYMMNFTMIGKMLISLLPSEMKYVIAIDRTNWDFGKTPINIMMLSLVYKNISIPICWKLLQKKGHSNFIERIELLKELMSIMPKEKIEYLVGDREFDGKEFIGYLTKEEIEFHIRIRHTITYNGHKLNKGRRIKKILDIVKVNEYHIYPKKVVIYEQMLYIGGKRLSDGDYLILISSKNPEKAQEIYKQRWTIEKLFNKMKKRGFNLESTHMVESKKLEKLIGLVSIAYLWAYLTGEEIKKTYSIEIKEKQIGKRMKSSIDLGIKYLRKIFDDINLMYNEFINLINLLSCA